MNRTISVRMQCDVSVGAKLATTDSARTLAHSHARLGPECQPPGLAISS